MRPLRAWLIRQGWQGKEATEPILLHRGFFVIRRCCTRCPNDLCRFVQSLSRPSHRKLSSQRGRHGRLIDSLSQTPLPLSTDFDEKGTCLIQCSLIHLRFHIRAMGPGLYKDLKRLVIACLRVLKPGGTLIIATNNGKMPPRDFSKAILDASRKEKNDDG